MGSVSVRVRATIRRRHLCEEVRADRGERAEPVPLLVVQAEDRQLAPCARQLGVEAAADVRQQRGVRERRRLVRVEVLPRQGEGEGEGEGEGL